MNEDTTNRTEVTNNRNDAEVATETRSSVLVSKTINANACCMCFGNHEDNVLDGNGADWIDCACGRWLHVECAEDCIKDFHGNQHYCPYCLDGLS